MDPGRTTVKAHYTSLLTMRIKTHNPHIKRMNYIWYEPGLGGNFLQRLFALSDDTQFLWRRGSCGCMPLELTFEERWRWYWYRDEAIKNWMWDAHLLPTHLELIWKPYEGWEQGSTLITAGHHWQSKDQVPDLTKPDPQWGQLEGVEEHYYQVQASKDLIKFMNQHLQLDRLVIAPLEPVYKDWFTKSVAPEAIDLEQILGTQQQFEAEYTRVCQLMQILPIDLGRAWQFQQNWRSQRVDRRPNLSRI